MTDEACWCSGDPLYRPCAVTWSLLEVAYAADVYYVCVSFELCDPVGIAAMGLGVTAIDCELRSEVVVGRSCYVAYGGYLASGARHGY